MGWLVGYLWENLKTSFGEWKEHQAMSNFLMFLFALLLAVGISIPIGDNWGDQLALFVGAWFGCLVLIITPVRMWKRQDDKVKKYEEQKIELVFDEDRYPGCKGLMKYYDKNGNVSGEHVYYRVGTRALGGNTIEGVEVLLTNFEPQGADFLPQALNPKDCPSDAPSTFSVDPGEIPSRYVEVIKWDKFRHEIEICYRQNYSDTGRKLPRFIPCQLYTFTLLVHGRDIPSFTRKFVGGVEGEEFKFYSKGNDNES